MADGNKTSTVAVNVSSIMTRFDVIRGIRTNPNSHQGFWPGDTFFQNVSSLLHKRLFWGVDGPKDS